MPEKVLVAGPNCAEIFCALGLDEFVIGKCMTNHSLGILDEYEDAYKKIPTLCEGYPTFDEIVDSGCDFLYASEWLFSDSLTPAMLEAAGILVMVNDAKSMVGIKTQLRDLCNVFCLDGRDKELMQAQSDAISAVAETVGDTKPKKILVVDSFVGDKVFTAGGNNIETEYIKSAGCVNVFAELEKPWDAVSIQDIVDANPDFIIIHNYKDSSYKSKVKALKENPELQYLDCIRNERFIKLSLENVMPGMRSEKTVEKIAYSVYYDLFAAPVQSPAPTATAAPD